MFVRDEITINAPLERVLARVRTYLRSDGHADAARDTAADQAEALRRAGVTLPGDTVELRTLPPVRRGGSYDIAVSWSASGTAHPLYPSLEGILTLDPVDETTTRLTILGSYLLPARDRGPVIEDLGGQPIAAATLSSFLDRLYRFSLHLPHPGPLSTPSRTPCTT